MFMVTDMSFDGSQKKQMRVSLVAKRYRIIKLLSLFSISPPLLSMCVSTINSISELMVNEITSETICLYGYSAFNDRTANIWR